MRQHKESALPTKKCLATCKQLLSYATDLKSQQLLAWAGGWATEAPVSLRVPLRPVCLFSYFESGPEIVLPTTPLFTFPLITESSPRLLISLPPPVPAGGFGFVSGWLGPAVGQAFSGPFVGHSVLSPGLSWALPVAGVAIGALRLIL